jgi:signal transduction histidine kinase
VEVAAYRIVVEAVTNAVRHAEADSCTVDLAVAKGELVVVVADDGRGRAGRPPGTGTRSMAERAEEIGGSLAIGDVTPTGTVVRALLPLGTGRLVHELPGGEAT